MDRLALVVEHKLYVVDEPEQQTREFVAEIVPLLLNEFHSRQSFNGRLQDFFRLRQRSAIAVGRDGMPAIVRRGQRGHTVGTGWTGG